MPPVPVWVSSRYNKNKNKHRAAWSISLTDFEQVVRKGCFFCSKAFNEIDRVVKARHMNGSDYNMHNTIVLCGVCDPLVNKNNIVPLAKQITHIGSKLDSTLPKVEYPDAFIKSTSQSTYDGYIKKELRCFVSPEEYAKMIHLNCTFCDRPDTTANRNNITIKKDYSINSQNNSHITICAPCLTLYKKFKTHTEFVTHIKLCARELGPKIVSYFSNKMFVKNPSLYINHSSYANSRMSYADAGIRIDGLVLGEWDAKFSAKNAEPLIDLKSEFYNDAVRYKSETSIVTRGSNFIDSLCLTPYKLTKAKTFDKAFSLSTIGVPCNIDQIIRSRMYPGFVEADSSVYVGVPCLNTKMRVVMDYDTSVKRIRFYCNYESITFCQCNNECDQCKRTIRQAMINEKRLAVQLKIDIGPNNQGIEFIKNTKTVYGITAASLNLKKNDGETDEEFRKRRKSEADKKLRDLKYSGPERERNLKIKNENQKRLRRAAGMKARKAVGDDPEVHQQAYKQRQAEKHGAEGVRVLNRLYKKIARAKQRPNFPAHILRKLEADYAKLKNS